MIGVRLKTRTFCVKGIRDRGTMQPPRPRLPVARCESRNMRLFLTRSSNCNEHLIIFPTVPVESVKLFGEFSGSEKFPHSGVDFVKFFPHRVWKFFPCYNWAFPGFPQSTFLLLRTTIYIFSLSIYRENTKYSVPSCCVWINRTIFRPLCFPEAWRSTAGRWIALAGDGLLRKPGQAMLVPTNEAELAAFYRSYSRLAGSGRCGQRPLRKR